MTLGSSTDQYDPASPTLASSRYCGIARVICGTSTPASSRLKIAVRARKRYFASANPAVADTSADATAPPPEYTRLLTAQRQNSPPRSADRSRRLPARPPWKLGAKVKVVN